MDTFGYADFSKSVRFPGVTERSIMGPTRLPLRRGLATGLAQLALLVHPCVVRHLARQLRTQLVNYPTIIKAHAS